MSDHITLKNKNQEPDPIHISCHKCGGPVYYDGVRIRCQICFKDVGRYIRGVLKFHFPELKEYDIFGDKQQDYNKATWMTWTDTFIDCCKHEQKKWLMGDA